MAKDYPALLVKAAEAPASAPATAPTASTGAAVASPVAGNSQGLGKVALDGGAADRQLQAPLALR
jgi:hypothetical protein